MGNICGPSSGSGGSGGSGGSSGSSSSSNIKYDGISFPDLGFGNGDNMSDVIASLANAITRMGNNTTSLQAERFMGVKDVKLRYNPVEIIQVSFGGVILPRDAYKGEGRTIKFYKKYCLGDEFADVVVLYRANNADILNSSCYA